VWWAEQVEPELRGANQVAWLFRLERDHENLRAALAACRVGPEGGEALQRLCGALFWFWHMHSHLSEGRRWLAEALHRSDAQETTPARARCLQGAGQLAYYQNDFEEARALLRASAAAWEALGDTAGRSAALAYLANATGQQTDIAEARAIGEESLTLARRSGDPWVLAMALWVLGVYGSARFGGSDAEATLLLEESAALFRGLGVKWGLGAPLFYLGQIERQHGDLPAARAHFEESLALFRAVGDRWRTALCLGTLADLTLEEGHAARASTLFEECRALWMDLGHRVMANLQLLGEGDAAICSGDAVSARWRYQESLVGNREAEDRLGVAHSLLRLARLETEEGDLSTAGRALRESLALFNAERLATGVCSCLEGLAAFAAACEKPAPATRVCAAADALRPTLGTIQPFVERKAREDLLRALRSGLGEEAFAAAWAEGRRMSVDQAIAEALKTAPQ
jgi:tetratricopeptide (TPR) repeat protein